MHRRDDASTSTCTDILAGIAPLAPARPRSCSTRTAASWPRTSVADVDLPPFDNSSMDGYAVRVGRRRRRRRERTRSQLPVVGDIAAGHRQALHACSPGCACGS